MIADPGYDDKKLYEYSKKVLVIDLVCPVKRYKSTSKKRLYYNRKTDTINPKSIKYMLGTG
jgi:hypothetical protein